MVTTVNPQFAATVSPPVMEARRWLDGTRRTTSNRLLNMSQAAPVARPPEVLRAAMSEFLLNEAEAHIYGPVLGNPELRQEIAESWSTAYGGEISVGQVAVTSGCNQAFAAAVSALAKSGDSVIITAPWYFNHKMWLDMMGIEARIPHGGGSMMPDPDAIARSITGSTRAIVLISPNNPTGGEYPGSLIREIHDLARDRRLALILDETYRDFDSRPGPVHDLFADPDWSSTFIHLYSFSKAYRLTGHRVGAMLASEKLLAEIEKFLDTVAICPNRIGQHAALFGIRNLSGWLKGQRAEILQRRSRIESGLSGLDGWNLLGCGAYFAYVEHPFDLPSDRLVLKLLADLSVLTLPGTMFAPVGHEGADRQLRIAYANIDQQGIADLFGRLHGYEPGSVRPGARPPASSLATDSKDA